MAKNLTSLYHDHKRAPQRATALFSMQCNCKDVAQGIFYNKLSINKLNWIKKSYLLQEATKNIALPFHM